MAKINKEKEALLPVKLLKELLRYEYETGLFYWIKRGHGRKFEQLAGSLNKSTGYIRIKINSYHYYAHRLAWTYVYGDFPIGEQPFIDHINGVKNDNRIKNLKACSSGENQRNQKITSRNTSGVMGITHENMVNSLGKVYYYWVARWYDEKSKRRYKLFSIYKLGEDEAKHLAVAYRVEQIRLLEENHNIIYSERHGT